MSDKHSLPSSDPAASSETAPSAGDAAALGVLSSFATLVGSIARSKVGAIVLGPAGVGVTAEVQQLVTLATVPVGSFSGPVLLSELSGQSDEGELAARLSASLSWTLVSAAVTGLAAVLLGPWFLSEGRHHALLVGLFVVATAGTSAVAVWSSFLVARQQLGTAARLAAVTSLLTSVVVVTLCLLFGIVGLFAGLAAAGVSGALAGWLLVGRRFPGVIPLLRFRLSGSFLVRALRVGVSAIIAGAALQGALFVTRSTLDAHGGPELNGQFQAAWSVGSLYFGFVFSGLGNYFFPRFAAAASQSELEVEVRRGARMVLSLCIPVIGIGLVLRDFGISVLFSDQFQVAANILAWQLAGDVAKALAWMQAGPLVLRGHLRLYLGVEIVAAVSLAGGTVLFVPRVGALGAGVAYFVAYLLYFVATAWALKAAEGVGVDRGSLLLAVASTTVFVAFILLQSTVLSVVLLVASCVIAWRGGMARQLFQRLGARLGFSR